MNQILTRTYKTSDLSFIFDSWLNSWRRSKWAGTIPNHIYYDTMRQTISGLLARGASVTVAHPDSDVEHILGWVCSESKSGIPIVHYLYVKDPYLDYPVARTLLDTLPDPAPGFVTHKLNFEELKAWRHAPEIARRKDL